MVLAFDSATRLVSALSGRDINARGCDDRDHSDEDETDEATDAIKLRDDGNTYLE